MNTATLEKVRPNSKRLAIQEQYERSMFLTICFDLV